MISNDLTSILIKLIITEKVFFKPKFIQKYYRGQYKISMDCSGHIELILGPMFSGKSSEMMRKVRRYEHAKKKCMIVNYVNDNRYSFEDVASTHDKFTMKAVKSATMQGIYERAKAYNVIAVDEGQFFPDLVEFAEKLANQGHIVIVAALDGTFQRKPFGSVLQLIPLAEKVDKLSAVCIDCGKEAAFTRRTVESNEIELIGGEQCYKPVCRKCFSSLKSIQMKEREALKSISSNQQQIIKEKINITNPESSMQVKLIE